jgi:hypothetical protein
LAECITCIALAIFKTSSNLLSKEIVIGDLGFTRKSSGFSKGGTGTGTSYYKPPELKTDLRSDIFMFAVVAAEILLKSKFTGCTEFDVLLLFDEDDEEEE